MAATSKIEWTDATWNPIRARNRETGKIGWHCVHVSEACRHCYAERMNKRLGTGLPYLPSLTQDAKGGQAPVEIFLDETMLLAPLRWKKPRMIFVCSMTDLFGEWVKQEWLDQIFAIMALCPKHTFQVLTKRPERMREYLSSHTMERQHAINGHVWSTLGTPIGAKIKHGGNWRVRALPLPNVWLGTSCEDQETADARIPHLLKTPSAVRFLSCEPSLGPIDLNAVSVDGETPLLRSVTTGDGRRIDWVIAGGESGPNARPMHPQWAQSLRDQCASAGVAFFFKQWGEWLERDVVNVSKRHQIFHADGTFGEAGITDALNFVKDLCVVERVGKKAASRLLDGIEHNAMPNLPSALAATPK